MALTVKKIDNIYHLIAGVQGENLGNPIRMDMTSWAFQHPGATFHALFKRPGDIFSYPVVTQRDGNIMTWFPTVTDTEYLGVGFLEVRAIDARTGMIKKSRIIPTAIERSVTGLDTEDPPEPFKDWVDIVLNARDEAEDARDEAMDAKELAQQAALNAISAGGLMYFEINDMGDLIMRGSIGLPYTFEINERGELIFYGRQS